MGESLQLVLVLIMGVLLGFIFYGGLWWTILKGLFTQNSALIFLGSLIVRTGIVMFGFYWINHGRWERLLVVMLGFLLARRMVSIMVRQKQEGYHAP